MKFCRDCVIRHDWVPTYSIGYGDCELCWDRGIGVFEVAPKKVESQVNPKFEAATLLEEAGKTLDKNEEFFYYTQCKNLFVYFRKGPRVGQIDEQTSEDFLGAINVTVNRVQDWKATYKRRLRAKQSYMSVEERIGG